MKKIFLFIVGLLFFGITFGYDVIIYDENNNVLMMYPVEQGTTEITLDGDWVKNGNNFTFNGGYSGTTIYYYDMFAGDSIVNVNSDVYLNGEYSIGYTGEQYSLLSNIDSCAVEVGYTPVFDVTGSTQPIDGEYNMFNNFTDNSLKVLLSNIPGFIQYGLIISVILLLLGIIKIFKRRS